MKLLYKQYDFRVGRLRPTPTPEIKDVPNVPPQQERSDRTPHR